MRSLQLVDLRSHELHLADLGVHYSQKALVSLIAASSHCDGVLVHRQARHGALSSNALLTEDHGRKAIELLFLPKFHLHSFVLSNRLSTPVRSSRTAGAREIHTLMLMLTRPAGLLLKLGADLFEQLRQAAARLRARRHATMRVVHSVVLRCSQLFACSVAFASSVRRFSAQRRLRRFGRVGKRQALRDGSQGNRSSSGRVVDRAQLSPVADRSRVERW